MSKLTSDPNPWICVPGGAQSEFESRERKIKQAENPKICSLAKTKLKQDKGFQIDPWAISKSNPKKMRMLEKDSK